MLRIRLAPALAELSVRLVHRLQAWGHHDAIEQSGQTSIRSDLARGSGGDFLFASARRCKKVRRYERQD
jgi:hypothetical protein